MRRLSHKTRLFSLLVARTCLLQSIWRFLFYICLVQWKIKCRMAWSPSWKTISAFSHANSLFQRIVVCSKDLMNPFPLWRQKKYRTQNWKELSLFLSMSSITYRTSHTLNRSYWVFRLFTQIFKSNQIITVFYATCNMSTWKGQCEIWSCDEIMLEHIGRSHFFFVRKLDLGWSLFSLTHFYLSCKLCKTKFQVSKQAV